METRSVVMVIAFTTTMLLSGLSRCPENKGSDVIDDTVIVVFPNNDILAPRGIYLLLNSTIKAVVHSNLCINRTKERGIPALIACTSEELKAPGQRHSKTSLKVQNGYIVLKVNELTATDNNTVYTWWSHSTVVGETAVTVRDSLSPVYVTARESKTLIVVLELDRAQYVDIGFSTKNGLGIYNYGPIHGYCHSHSNDILPSHGGSYYLTTFKDVDCNMNGKYRLSATVQEGSVDNDKIIDVNLRVEELTLTVYVSVNHIPKANGDAAGVTLTCSASGPFISLKWLFNEDTLQTKGHQAVNTTHSMSFLTIYDMQAEDSGLYSCRVTTKCGNHFESQQVHITKIQEISTFQVSTENDHVTTNQWSKVPVQSTQQGSNTQASTTVSTDGMTSTSQQTDSTVMKAEETQSTKSKYNTTMMSQSFTQGIGMNYSHTSMEPSTNESPTDDTYFVLLIILSIVIFLLLVVIAILTVRSRFFSTIEISTLHDQPFEPRTYDAVHSTDEAVVAVENWEQREDSLIVGNVDERSDDSRCQVKILKPNMPLLESRDGLYEPVEYDYDHLLFCERGFLGRGEFGVVQKAVVSDERYECVDQEVAVKCLKENATMEDREDSLREIEIMRSLSAGHPNVIALLGFCRDPLCIIIEMAVNGNLKNYLLKNRSSSDYQNILPNSRNLRSYDLLQFAWQISKGMSFIASKKIIHRDLATRNILLDGNRCCKISDFGFARDVSDTNTYQRKSQLRGRLPIRWMALESLLYSTYTTQSDVWSYGVLLWEIVTLGATPYVALPPSEVIQKLRGGGRLLKPIYCSDKFYQIMVQCWKVRAETRPSFSNICVQVGNLASDVAKEYIILEEFDEHLYENTQEDLEQWPLSETLQTECS